MTNLEEVDSIQEDEDPTVRLVERSRRGEAPHVDRPTIVPPQDRTVNIVDVKEISNKFYYIIEKYFFLVNKNIKIRDIN